jgi:hypothetical protein
VIQAGQIGDDARGSGVADKRLDQATDLERFRRTARQYKQDSNTLHRPLAAPRVAATLRDKRNAKRAAPKARTRTHYKLGTAKGRPTVRQIAAP